MYAYGTLVLVLAWAATKSNFTQSPKLATENHSLEHKNTTYRYYGEKPIYIDGC